MPVENALSWLAEQESLQLTSTTASEKESAIPVSLCMANRPFFIVLDEICRQSGRYWSVSENTILTMTESVLKTIPNSVREWGARPSFLPPEEPDCVRMGVDGHGGAHEDHMPCVPLPPDIETQLKTVKIHWEYYDLMSGRDILDAFKRTSLKAVKNCGGKRFSVSLKPDMATGWHKKRHVVCLHDISIYDAFFFIGEMTGAEVSFSNGTFVFSGKDIPPAPLPKYRRELVQTDHDPDLRRDMFLIVNRKPIPHVKFVDMPVSDALGWLSKRQSVSVSSVFDPDEPEGVAGLPPDHGVYDLASQGKARVDLDMTNTTFLAVVDEICRQSDRHWGFLDKIFMTFPASRFRQGENHPSGTGWIHMKHISTE
jgi:hypothetical protein